MSDLTRDAIDRLADLGSAGRLVTMDAVADPVVLVPNTMNLKSLAEFFPPKRIKQHVHLHDAGSFIEYVNKFKTQDTTLFARVNVSDGQDFTETVHFIAHLDYHTAAPSLKPAYCSHIAGFAARPTVEWIEWMAANGEAKNQVEFATWLEDHAKLFVEPSGAELLELVRSLHGHRNARFNTALRLDNGAYSASYEEEITVRGTSATQPGAIDLPAFVKAGIAPFEGCPPYEITARFKTRVEERRLRLWFETVAPHVILRDAITAMMKQIALATKITPLLGSTGST